MTVNIESISEIGPTEWERFVLDHPLATIYHHSAWHDVIERTYGHGVRYCTVRDGNLLQAALPFVVADDFLFGRRIISLPYSDTCDPLIANDEQMRLIKDGLMAFGRTAKCNSLEIRGFRTPVLIPSRNGNQRKYVNFLLSLDKQKESLFRSLHPSCIQRGIRKAEHGSLKINEENSLRSLRAFYDLHVGTRKRHGLPVQPFTFFQNLWSSLYPRGMISVLLADSNDTSVAGIVVLKFRDILYYKFAASDVRFLRERPNHLLMWHLLQKGLEDCSRYLDLGRTYTGDKGLMEWKRRWGGDPYYLRYTFSPDRTGPVAQEGGRAHLMLSGILRHMPCFVIKMSGALLYRYMA